MSAYVCGNVDIYAHACVLYVLFLYSSVTYFFKINDSYIELKETSIVLYVYNISVKKFIKNKPQKGPLWSETW